MRIALVGYGKMGGALLSQWLQVAPEKFADVRFVVIDPMVGETAPSDPGPHAEFVPEPPPVSEGKFDLVIVAVKPQILDKVLPAYAEMLAPDGFVASIAAGCSIARIRSLAGGAPTVRIMPNLPAAIGQGVSGLCAGDAVTPEQREVVETLMEAAGTALWVEDEDKLDRLTAVAGSGPGYVFEMARTYVEAAKSLGFNHDEARQLVLGTLEGTIAMALRSDLELDELRTSVTSKNGTTAAGLDALNGDGSLDKLLKATVDAAYERAVELR